MLKFVHEKTFQTVVLAALLFYVFGNPDTFKMVSKIPGLKFVMSKTTGITHSGVATHALVFAVFLYCCVYLINTSLVKKHLGFLNVVGGVKEHLSTSSACDGKTDRMSNYTMANYISHILPGNVDEHNYFLNRRGIYTVAQDSSLARPEDTTCTKYVDWYKGCSDAMRFLCEKSCCGKPDRLDLK